MYIQYYYTIQTCIFLMVFFFVGIPNESKAQDYSDEPFIHRPFQFTFLFTPIGTNGLESGKVVNCLSFNLFSGYSAGVDCLEFGSYPSPGIVN